MVIHGSTGQQEAQRTSRKTAHTESGVKSQISDLEGRGAPGVFWFLKEHRGCCQNIKSLFVVQCRVMAVDARRCGGRKREEFAIGMQLYLTLEFEMMKLCLSTNVIRIQYAANTALI